MLTKFARLLLTLVLAAVSFAPLVVSAQDAEVVIRYPITSDPASLEPGLVKELVSSLIAGGLHAGLLTYDGNTELVPYLAESYDISDDGLVYTFHINPAAKWHNGRAVTAGDFKAGWTRYLDAELAAQAAGAPFLLIVGAQEVWDGTAEDVTGIVAVDDQTLEVTLKTPTPRFLGDLGTTPTWVVPAESVVAGSPTWVDQPVGAGPFKFVEWTPNVQIVLEANEDFFLGAPAIDRIEFKIVPDAATSLAQYEAGELDIVSVPAAELARISADATLGAELNYFTRAQLQYLGFNQSQFEPFQNVLVRQAFNYAIDKDVLANQVLNGIWVPATGLVPPNIPEYNEALDAYGYDPVKAAELLAEAGYPGGEGFPALELAGLDSTIAETVAAMLSANLNIEISIVKPERGAMIDGLWAHDTWETFLFGWTADRPSASVWTYELLYSGLGSNFSTYSNPEVDALLDQALVSADLDEAKSLWQQAEAVAIQDAALAPLGYARYIYLVKPNLEGFAINLIGAIPFEAISVAR